jgi:hypothetical protein
MRAAGRSKGASKRFAFIHFPAIEIPAQAGKNLRNIND